MIRPPTLRTVGIAGLVIGAVGLVAPFAWKSFWPDPIGSIDAPVGNASLAGCTIASGRVVPSSVWRRPLWLIRADDGRGWRPLTRIDPWMGTWQHRTCVHGQTGDKNRLALVVADAERDQAFKRALIEPDDRLPGWLKARDTGEQGCPGRRRGFDRIPEGATLVSSVEVTVLDGDPPPCSMGSPYSDGSLPRLLSGADEGQGRRRRHERRVVRGRIRF